MKILIGVDRSPASEYAVAEALARPWPAVTEFSIIHVVDEYGLVRFPALVKAAKEPMARSS